MPGILILHARCLILLLAAASQPATLPMMRPGLTPVFSQAESLEWMAIDSPVIVRGRVQSITKDELIVNVSETIKGNAPAWIRVPPFFSQAPIPTGTHVLVFFDNSSAERSRTIALDGTWAVPLMDFHTASNPQEILAIVREHAKAPAVKSRALVPPRSYSTSLLVPLNHHLEELGQAWAKDTSLHNRLLGIQALRPFKSPQNVALITNLLNDTRSLTPAGFLGFGGKWKRGYYVVRSDAADLLSDWNVPIPDLPNGGPILPYRPLEISKRWLVASIAALAIWLIAAIFLRARLLRLTLLIACLVIAAASIFGWIRSRHHVDEIMFASKASHHELASCDSGLQYVILRDWTEPRGAFVGHFDRAITEDLWSIEGMHRSTTYHVFGFAFTRGRTPGPEDKPLPYTLIRIPYWALALPPLAFLARRTFISLRGIRRRRLGLCQKCAYDLRETPTGICPECGDSNHRIKAGNEVPVGAHGIRM